MTIYPREVLYMQIRIMIVWMLLTILAVSCQSVTETRSQRIAGIESDLTNLRAEERGGYLPLAYSFRRYFPETAREKILSLRQEMDALPGDELEAIGPLLGDLRLDMAQRLFAKLMKAAAEPQDGQDWNAMSRSLEKLFEQYPALLDKKDNASRAEKLLARYAGKTLEVGIIESSTNTDHRTGYSRPLKLQTHGVDSNAPVSVRLSSSNTLRFDGGKVTVELRGSGLFRIEKLEIDPDMNRINVSAHWQAEQFLAILSKAFSLPKAGVLAVSPQVIALRTRIHAQNRFEGVLKEIWAVQTGNEQAVFALAGSLEQIMNDWPELNSVTRNQAEVERLGSRFPRVRISSVIREPAETLYVSTGFSTPLEVEMHIDNPERVTVYDPVISVRSAGGLVFAGSRKEWQTRITNQQRTISTKLPVTAASSDPGKNRIIVDATYPGQRLFSLLEKYFPGRAPGLHIDGSSYALQARLSSGNMYYDTISGYGAKFVSVSKLTNGIQAGVAVAWDGGFTIGGRAGNAVFDLMYGHPNGVSADGIWSSIASIMVDGTPFRIRDIHNKTVTKETNGDLLVRAYMLTVPIEIEQRLRPVVRNGQASVLISIIVKNNDKVPHMLGVRLMLDTWPGQTDDITFIIPGPKGSNVISHEVEFTPAWSPVWQTYDLPAGRGQGDRMLCMQNITVGKGLVPPDRIAFASWPRAYRSEWDFYVNTNYSVTGWSSSTILWWNPVKTEPKKQMAASTQFGLAEQLDGPMLYSTDPDNTQEYSCSATEMEVVALSISAMMYHAVESILLPDNEDLTAIVKPNTVYMKNFCYNCRCRQGCCSCATP